VQCVFFSQDCIDVLTFLDILDVKSPADCNALFLKLPLNSESQ